MGKKNIARRAFLKQTGIASTGIFASQLLGQAFSQTIVRNNGSVQSLGKNISSQWLKSLYERGVATTYLKSKNELQYIGMPVGGINCGTMYLSGDGRLWLWDIFNLNQEGVNPLEVPWTSPILDHAAYARCRDGSAYVAPARADELRVLAQGFAIKFEHEGKTVVRQLREKDWSEVSFEATYPVATITYTDKALPIEVIVQAYSPFIPLEADKSGLPATIFSIQMKNTGTQDLKVDITGWLENKTALYSARQGQLRNNIVFKQSSISGVFSSVANMSINPTGNVKEKFDYGTLCLAALNPNSTAGASIDNVEGDSVFSINKKESVNKSSLQTLIGNVVTSLTVEAAKSATADFVISWHSPNLSIHGGKYLPKEDSGQYYDNQFHNAKEVAEYIATNFNELSTKTILWKNTWYDSSLPYWFLDRTFLNISALASTTAHRFKSGRFWAWEGVGACEGNCTHVWQYAQAVGRIFPSLERETREKIDLGLAQQEDGGIWFRAEYAKVPAIDGQAGTVLRIYREHQMTTDNAFLHRNWEKTKKAVQYIFKQDRNNDGMEDTPVENTLDAQWDGEIAWIVGICIAAVKSAELMAIEMNDKAFAATCKEYVEKGRKNMEEKLFNGEYFIHRPDPVKGKSGLGSYNTCHIDQVYGQSWAYQVGLGRILDEAKTKSALKSLWKYNFITDMGAYNKTHTGARPFAVDGESGLVMNSNPKNEDNPYGVTDAWQLGYFHECMTGFEHQVAAHMMAEGMTDESLAITKAVHDRYHAAKRNPFNEIECSDHYARAMASYGTFITACGFEYHGPKKYIRFAPRWNKENFKAPFTSAEGWGSYAQQLKGGTQIHQFEIKYGNIELKKFSVEKMASQKLKSVSVTLDGKSVSANMKQEGTNIIVELSKPVKINTNQMLVLSLV